MAIFADLAAETAERILLYVEDSWTLFNCLLVCQWFHAVAQRAYYHKVTLTNRVKIKFPHSPRSFSILLLFFCQPKNIHLAKSVKTLILRGDDKVSAAQVQLFHNTAAITREGSASFTPESIAPTSPSRNYPRHILPRYRSY